MVYNEIMKIENIHSLAVEQKQRKYNTTPTFTGFNINNAIKVSQSTVDKFVKKAGTDLHLDVPTNKNAFAYLTDKFKYDDRSKVLAAYQSCMDSSGKVNQAAMDILDDNTVGKSSFIKSLFGSKKGQDKGKFTLEDVTRLLEAAKDVKKQHVDDNLDFLKSILTLKVSDNSEYLKYLKRFKRKDGTVEKGTFKKFKDFFKKYPNSKDSSILNYCLDYVKNKNGEISWNNLKTFYNLRRDIIKVCGADDKYNIFDKTLSVVKDPKGELLQDRIDAVRGLQAEDLLGEISYLIKSAIDANEHLDRNLLKKSKNIITNISKPERINVAKVLANAKDSFGNPDANTIQGLESLVKSRVRSHILEILKVAQKSDGSYSMRLLDLGMHLRKNSHHQIEEDLPELLNMCKNSNGVADDKKIAALKKIQSYKPHVRLPLLFNIVLTKGEVDGHKLKSLGEILYHTKNSDQGSLKVALKLASDKSGNIDFPSLRLFWKIRSDAGSLNGYKDLIPVFKSFVKYKNVSSFDQLSLSQKRDLMRLLTKYKSEIRDARFTKYLNSKILPTSDDAYCQTLGKLSHSLGVNVKRLPRAVEGRFWDVINDMQNPHSEFMKLDFDKNPPKLTLNYSIKDFQKDVWSQIKNLKYSDRIKALDGFGFELKMKNGVFEMNGFPNLGNVGHSNRNAGQDVQNAIKKVTPLVEKFTQNNHVNIAGAPKLSQEITDLTKAFPEFLTTIGKPQHHTHDYTLDVHLLKVLQSVFKDPEYKTLSVESQKQLQLAALFHDINKTSNAVDTHHPEKSGFDMYYLLDKLNLEEKDKLKIYHIIKNHAWLSKYNTSGPRQNAMAKELAYELRQNNAFKMISILTKADLKGVKKYDVFYKRFGKDLVSARKKIEPLIFQLQKNAINLPQTEIPKAHKLNHNSPYVHRIFTDGIKNSVIELRHGIDLKKVGFEENLSLNDLNILVHGLSTKNDASMFQALGTLNSKALLSTSYINYGKGNWKVFRPQGFVLGVPAQDIQAAYYRDFGSGYNKTQATLFDTYLWKSNPQREYIPNLIKKELHLSDKKYISLYEKIEDKSISELDVKYPKVAKSYRKIFKDMEIAKRTYGRNYNEILVTRPKIQAVFCYNQQPQNLPSYLRKYAQDNDLPILVFN